MSSITKKKFHIIGVAGVAQARAQNCRACFFRHREWWAHDSINTSHVGYQKKALDAENQNKMSKTNFDWMGGHAHWPRPFLWHEIPKIICILSILVIRGTKRKLSMQRIIIKCLKIFLTGWVTTPIGHAHFRWHQIPKITLIFYYESCGVSKESSCRETEFRIKYLKIMFK